MAIHLATDHAGFELKNVVSTWLQEEGYEVIDHGAVIYEPEDDFPDYIAQAAAAVSQHPSCDKGIIFGGSGQGEAMVANRFKAVRATVYYGGNESIIKLSRQHNDANVLSIGARFVDADTAKRLIWEWLHTETLSEEKYHRRNLKMESVTKKLHL